MLIPESDFHTFRWIPRSSSGCTCLARGSNEHVNWDGIGVLHFWRNYCENVLKRWNPLQSLNHAAATSVRAWRNPADTSSAGPQRENPDHPHSQPLTEAPAYGKPISWATSQKIYISSTISFVSFHISFQFPSHSTLSFRSSIVRTYKLHSLRLHPTMYSLRKKGYCTLLLIYRFIRLLRDYPDLASSRMISSFSHAEKLVLQSLRRLWPLIFGGAQNRFSIWTWVLINIFWKHWNQRVHDFPSA